MLAASSASSNAEPGTLAFLIVFALAVVVVFLFRSMSKQLRKVNAAARQDESAAAKDPARAAEPRKDS
jgi:NADH:ubiquinone oxidoreductase subunit 6 (subunit J)